MGKRTGFSVSPSRAVDGICHLSIVVSHINMNLSVVTTLYCSAPHLKAFYARIKRAVEAITPSYEIIFVNDGSPDESLEIALALYQRDPKVKVIDLSRNFGHHQAILAGLARAGGDLIFLIDCDLEEDPELLEVFHQRLRTCGADVVYGVQSSRKGRWFERLSGEAFYAVFNALSHTPIPRNLLTVRLMTRRYVAGLVAHRDREVYLPGLLVVTGFRQEPLPVHKHHREASTYTLNRKVSLLVDAVTSFSSKPLVFIFYLGTAILVFSGAAGLLVLARKIFFNSLLLGWISLIISVWFLGGMAIFCQGIIGIYLAKVFAESKQRPRTIIRQFHAREEGAELWEVPPGPGALPEPPQAEGGRPLAVRQEEG